MKCPCEQCICLAICKCRVNSTKSVSNVSLILECEILDKYLGRAGDGRTKGNYWTEIDATRLVYNLRPLFKGWYREDKK